MAGTTELVRNGSVHDTAAAIQEQTAILPDYDFAAGEGTGTSISGIVGALMTCALAGGVGLVVFVTKRKQTKGTTGK